MADQEQAYKLLLSTNPKTNKEPDKYVRKDMQANMIGGVPVPTNSMPQAGNSPLNAIGAMQGKPIAQNPMATLNQNNN